MCHLSDDYVFGGLAGLELDFEEYAFGEGVALSRTYAHLMAPFLMAFSPSPPGKPHPAPWKAASGGFGYDITAQLKVPTPLSAEWCGDRISLATRIVALMRLWASPSITLPVVSNISFSAAAGVPDNTAKFVPVEIEPRYFRLEAPEGRSVTPDQLEWVKEHWQLALSLMNENAEFRLAVDALDQGQFLRVPSLTLVSLWGALEALFSPAKAELRFRVSALIAAYLEEPSEARLALQKRVAKLYDARSAAAHGRPKDDIDILLGTFELLRRVIVKMITDNHVPSKDELEEHLFGASE